MRKTKAQPASITLQNIQMYARHGVLPEERLLGGRYEADVTMAYDTAGAAATDDLAQAVDYTAVADCVYRVLSGNSFKLIETAAMETLKAILAEFPAVEQCGIRLRKRNLPMQHNVDGVQIEQYMSRESGDGQ